MKSIAALSPEQQVLLQQRCDGFDSAWRNGLRPSLSEHLQGAATPLRAPLFRELLFRELLQRDISHRLRAGEQPNAGDYREFWDEFEAVVHDLLSKSTNVDGETLRDPGELQPACGDLNTKAPLDARFEIIRTHAEGGLGKVSLAKDVELSREVALKEMKFGVNADPESRKRFLLEAEVTGRLEHPGIVPVYSLGSYPDGRPFYAMKFVRGDSLDDAIKNRFHKRNEMTGREWAMELRKSLGRFVEVCRAIHYAHSRGVLHRDIKPQNIMLGKFGETLVVDWGLAKTLGESGAATESVLAPNAEVQATFAGSVVGTPAFMSPEQAAGKVSELGPSSDVYSLGATLYAVITGTTPLKGGTAAAVLEKVKQGDFKKPRQIDHSISADLEAICLKAMAKKPENRYETADDLAADIERYLADEPVAARREPIVERGRRWVWRHRTFSAVATVGTVSILVLIAVAWFQADRMQQRERQHAQELERQQYERTARLKASAEAQHAIALGELRAGRWHSAEQLLSAALQSLPQHDELKEKLTEIEKSRNRISALIGFRQDHGEAFIAAGREYHHREALFLCDQALDPLDLENPQTRDAWWDALPTDDLTEQQRTDFANEVHDLLLLRASLLVKDTVLNITDPKQAPRCRDALKSLAIAEAYRRTSYTDLVITFCHYRLGEIHKARNLKDLEPATSSDFFFFGFIYMYLAFVGTDDASSQFVIKMVENISGLEFTEPWLTADAYFRQAAEAEPQLFWRHFMVAWVNHIGGAPYNAERALHACLALRPDDPHANGLLGAVMINQGLQQKFYAQNLRKQSEDESKPELLSQAKSADKRSQLFIARGDQAYKSALRQEPDNPWLLQIYGYSQYALLRHSESFNTFIKLLQLERPHSEYETNAKWIIRDRETINHAGADEEWLALQAISFWKLEKLTQAAETAQDCLNLNPNNTVAVIVRAAVKMKNGENESALQDANAALEAAPNSFFGLMIKGQTLEQMDRSSDALAVFEAALEVSQEFWQREESTRAQARVLKKLGRPKEAAAALKRADALSLRG